MCVSLGAYLLKFAGLLTGFLVLPLERALWSLAGAVAINLTISLNHRSDRYIVL